MDHLIENLDECVYDHLVSTENELQSINKIYSCIIGQTGHRCFQLSDPRMRDIYKKKFVTTCHSLDNSFKDIHKKFKNNTLYLLYSTKEIPMEVYNNYQDESIFEDINNLHPSDIIDYMLANCKNFNFNEYFNEKENPVHYLVRNNKLEQFKKLLTHHEVDLNNRDRDGKDVMDIAMDGQNCKIMKEIIEYKHANRVLDLMNENRELRKSNSEYAQDNRKLRQQHNDLQKVTSSKEKNIFLTHVFYVVILIGVGIMHYNSI